MADRYEPTANPLRREDAATLLGIVVTIQGELESGEAPSDVTNRVRARLVRHGDLPEKNEGDAAFRALLSSLNDRLRYALGEYEDDAPPR